MQHQNQTENKQNIKLTQMNPHANSASLFSMREKVSLLNETKVKIT